jgi:hypothetical protein
LLLRGLARLVRSLTLTCIKCFAGGVSFFDLARLATLTKLVIVSRCLEALRSFSGVGPLGRLFIEFAHKSC